MNPYGMQGEARALEAWLLPGIFSRQTCQACGFLHMERMYDENITVKN